MRYETVDVDWSWIQILNLIKLSQCHCCNGTKAVIARRHDEAILPNSEY